LSNHGSTIAILLKNEAESVNLLTLEEIHLIVALCTNVLPSVPKTELVRPLMFTFPLISSAHFVVIS
jgi:nuclear pore complex protein Nup205